MSRAPGSPPTEATILAECVLTLAQENEADWVAAMQLQDDDIKAIVDSLKRPADEVPTQVRLDYEFKKSRLYRRVHGERKPKVPKAVRWRIVRYCNDESGHFGFDKTVERISKDFWFPRIRRYVKSYIAACPDCCLHKAKGGKPGQLHETDTLPVPFRRVHLDHVGPFPRSKRSNQYIVVLVCSFTKYTLLRAVRNTKSHPVLVMLREMMSVFGQPVQIVTDRGTAYTSREFESYLRKYGIKHVKTAVRTPRAKGQAERIIETILPSIKCTSSSSSKYWDETLPTIQWAINSQSNASTKFCPNDLVFNFNLRNVSKKQTSSSPPRRTQ